MECQPPRGGLRLDLACDGFALKSDAVHRFTITETFSENSKHNNILEKPDAGSEQVWQQRECAVGSEDEFWNSCRLQPCKLEP
jgi:hypothetical protein